MNIIKKKTNRKLNRKRKNITRLRGGAAAVARPTKLSGKSEITARSTLFSYNNSMENGRPVNNVLYTGNAHMEYLTTKYDFRHIEPPFSDHAPVSYTIPGNPYIKLITWNVAQFGNQIFTTPDGKVSFNHKFIIKGGMLEHTGGLETKDMYISRLNNLAFSFMDILKSIKSEKKTQSFLFCQELPFIPKNYKYNDDNHIISVEIYKEFKRKLEIYGLGLNGSPNSECGLIYLLNDTSNSLTYVPDLSDQRNSVYYSISKIINPDGKEHIYVYVNMHLGYITDFNKIISANIKKIINNKEFSAKYHLASIYFIGDMNKSLRYQEYNFINPSNVETFTTPNDEGFSYKNNNGDKNKHNVDYLMKVNF
jgi:hypothetical protein